MLLKCESCSGYFTSETGHLCTFNTILPTATDPVNWPAHYTKGGIQPIDFIVSNEMDFCTGNCIKYLTRHKYKNGLEDLKKARFYLDRLIAEYEKKS